jgi:hypothetical protein
MRVRATYGSVDGARVDGMTPFYGKRVERPALRDAPVGDEARRRAAVAGG